MEDEPQGHHHPTLHEYLRALRRCKWIVLEAVVLVPAAARTWEDAEGPASPEAIRNLIGGAVYGANTR